MANQTIFIKSVNEPGVIRVHRGNVRSVQRYGERILVSLKYTGNSRFVTLELSAKDELVTIYGLSTAVPIRSAAWGEFVRFSELTEAQKGLLAKLA